MQSLCKGASSREWGRRFTRWVPRKVAYLTCFNLRPWAPVSKCSAGVVAVVAAEQARYRDPWVMYVRGDVHERNYVPEPLCCVTEGIGLRVPVLTSCTDGLCQSSRSINAVPHTGQRGSQHRHQRVHELCRERGAWAHGRMLIDASICNMQYTICNMRVATL